MLNGTIHEGYNALVQMPVNIQAFTTTFTWQADCSMDPDCGNGFVFMILGANDTNYAYTPGFNFSGDASNMFSWGSYCPPTNDDNTGCRNTWDAMAVKFDLYGNSGPGQNLTNLFQSGGLPGTVASVGSDGEGAYITLNSALPALPPNGAALTDFTPSEWPVTSFISAGSTNSKLYLASTSGISVNDRFSVGNAIGAVNPHSASDISMASAGINIQSGDVMSTTLTYNGTTMVESVTDTVTSANFTHTYTTDAYGNAINLPSLVGANTAFVGFGASNGDATMDLNLLGWTYTVESPGPTPSAKATATAAEDGGAAGDGPVEDVQSASP
jgi:Legume lectin domain